MNSISSIKLVDFGNIHFSEPEILSKTFGSPYYKAPEAFKNNNYTEKSDIYSCGVIMHILLTGEPPYTGSTIEELQANVLNCKRNGNGGDLMSSDKVSGLAKDLVNQMLA